MFSDSSASSHGPVLVPSAPLTRHGPVQGAVEVGGRVRPGVSGRHSFRHKVGLFPPGFPVDLPQLLVLPHTEEDLTGKLDNSAGVFCPLAGHVHQAVDTSCLQQRPEDRIRSVRTKWKGFCLGSNKDRGVLLGAMG